MGKVVTPKYRVEMRDNDGSFVMPWNVTGGSNITKHGEATDANLERYVFTYAKSLEIGGVNEHISVSRGHVPYPTEAKIVNQRTGEIVATWKAGMFQIF